MPVSQQPANRLLSLFGPRITPDPDHSSICNESPEFEDLDGDGLPELIFGSQPESQMGYVSLPGSKLTSGKWPFRAISRKGDPMKNGTFKYYHGLGIGDINRDGRADVVIPHGWGEAPAEPDSNLRPPPDDVLGKHPNQEPDSKAGNWIP